VKTLNLSAAGFPSRNCGPCLFHRVLVVSRLKLLSGCRSDSQLRHYHLSAYGLLHVSSYVTMLQKEDGDDEYRRRGTPDVLSQHSL
jgi:hypothetical protein